MYKFSVPPRGGEVAALRRELNQLRSQVEAQARRLAAQQEEINILAGLSSGAPTPARAGWLRTAGPVPEPEPAIAQSSFPVSAFDQLMLLASPGPHC